MQQQVRFLKLGRVDKEQFFSPTRKHQVRFRGWFAGGSYLEVWEAVGMCRSHYSLCAGCMMLLLHVSWLGLSVLVCRSLVLICVQCLFGKQQSGRSIAFHGVLKLLATVGNYLLVGVSKVILATTTATLLNDLMHQTIVIGLFSLSSYLVGYFSINTYRAFTNYAQVGNSL